MASILNVSDFRAAAKRKLPKPIFHYLDGGADDEVAMDGNRTAFDRYRLLPRQLNDVASIRTQTRVFERELQFPLLLSPTGMTRLFHVSRESAVARAADRAGIYYCLSTMATTSIEDIAHESAGAKMLQIYIHRDRGLTRHLIEKARQAGFDALCLTVDTPVAGNRERDQRTGFVMPPRITLRNVFEFAMRPSWAFDLLRDPAFDLVNVAHRVDGLAKGPLGIIAYVNEQFDRSVTWDDAAEIIDQWGGPFVIKGLQSPEDGRRAAEIGATGIMLSNHGGRQLDHAAAPIDCITAMRQAVGGDMELVVDGGVRRGTDAIKALALGADAVAFGRPYLYALAANGERGVNRLLDNFRSELSLSLALLGVNDISQLSADYVVEVGKLEGEMR